MDADVLLLLFHPKKRTKGSLGDSIPGVETNLVLDHPHSLLSHLVHDSKYVHVIVTLNVLQNAVQGNEGPRSSHTSTRDKRFSAEKEKKRWTDLQCTTIGLLESGRTRSRNALTNFTRVTGGSGTPKSGHVVKWKCLTMRDWSSCSIIGQVTDTVSQAIHQSAGEKGRHDVDAGRQVGDDLSSPIIQLSGRRTRHSPS